MNQEHPLLQEELMGYADGQLQDGHAEQIAAHMESCSECAKAVADARRLSMLMATWQIEQAPKQLTESVLAAFDTRPHRRNSGSEFGGWTRGRVLAWGFGGAFAVLILFVVAVPSLLRSRQATSEYKQLNAQLPASSPSTEMPQSDIKKIVSGEAGQGQGQQGTLGQLSKSTADSPTGPMVIRTAQLTLITKEFDGARARIEAIVRESKGYIDHLTVRSDPGSSKSLSAVLRFPSDTLDARLADLRKLGQPKEETQNSSDITGQYTDLVARLNNARNTEQRLLALLRDRTGNLKDVVAAEGEIARVREEIERMEAERKGFDNKVQYATVQVELMEEYHAQVQPGTPGAGTRIHNAAVEGYEGASETILGIALWGLTYGPALIVWLVVLSSLGFLAWKLYRRVHS